MQQDAEGEATRPVRVWDLPVRLFHWALAALFVVQWISGKAGKLDIHMTLGAAVLSLLLFRLAWGLVGSRTARFADFVRGPAAAGAYLRGLKDGRPWPGLGHNPLGGWSVVLLLGLLLAQGSAGLFASDDIATDGPLAWMVSSKATATLSAVHRLGAKLLLALVALHLSAVFFYLFAKKENLIRPMLTGCKPVSPDLAAKAERLTFASPWLALALLALSAGLVFGGLAVWGK